MLEHNELLPNLDVFHGELSPARAAIYARLPDLHGVAGLLLSGEVRGPRCLYSQTLPSSYPLKDVGPGQTLLSRAMLTDPCYWSPQTPHIYDVRVELRQGSDVVASETRQIGLRPLGVSGRFLTWESKPWVLRGVELSKSTPQAAIASWRDHSLVLLSADLDDQQLRDASEQGILCCCPIGTQSASLDDVTRKVRRLARFPAVAIIAVPSQSIANVAQLAPNILVARNDVPETFLAPEPSLQMMPVDNHRASFTRVAVELKIPILMRRPIPSGYSPKQARAACDKLQADLAPLGQFAGYIV